MPEIGSMEIVGRIDNSQIYLEMDKLRRQMRSTTAETDIFTQSMRTLGTAAGVSFAAIVGGITGIFALGGPRAQVAMEKIGTWAEKMSMEVDEQMAGVYDYVADVVTGIEPEIAAAMAPGGIVGGIVGYAIGGKIGALIGTGIGAIISLAIQDIFYGLETEAETFLKGAESEREYIARKKGKETFAGGGFTEVIDETIGKEEFFAKRYGKETINTLTIENATIENVTTKGGKNLS